MHIDMISDKNVHDALAPAIGKPCCPQRVGRGRSLSVDFGERVLNQRDTTMDPFYGEWEFGTYSSAWRIVQAGHVVCGSSDIVDSISELNGRLRVIPFGAIVSLEQTSRFDIRLLLDGELSIDFMCASNDGDHIFHIFGPNNIYIE